MSTPRGDISYRNYLKWKDTFDTTLVKYLSEFKLQKLADLTRRVLSDALGSDKASTFNTFDIIRSLLRALAPGCASGKLFHPVAFQSYVVRRSTLAEFEHLPAGRSFARKLYRILPMEHRNNDDEFDSLLWRSGIEQPPPRNDSRGARVHPSATQVMTTSSRAGGPSVPAKRSVDDTSSEPRKRHASTPSVRLLPVVRQPTDSQRNSHQTAVSDSNDDPAISNTTSDKYERLLDICAKDAVDQKFQMLEQLTRIKQLEKELEIKEIEILTLKAQGRQKGPPPDIARDREGKLVQQGHELIASVCSFIGELEDCKRTTTNDTANLKNNEEEAGISGHGEGAAPGIDV